MAGSTGSASMGASSSTVISLIPEGSAVKKGDVLARLDGSTYEEMLRQQIIVVEQAKASHLQAQLNHEIAKIALHEYIEGTAKELVQEMNASIYLARTSLNQAPGAPGVDQEDEREGLCLGRPDGDRQADRHDLRPGPSAPGRGVRPVRAVHAAQDPDDPPGGHHHLEDHARERTGQAQPAGRAARAAQEAGGPLHHPRPARWRRLLLLQPQPSTEPG